jgi:hypothetical protein
MAAGRQVIAGQTLHLPADSMPDVRPEGRLVSPQNVESMVGDGGQFSYTTGPEPSAEEVFADLQRALREDRRKERRILRQRVERLHNVDTQVGLIRDFYQEVAG